MGRLLGTVSRHGTIARYNNKANPCRCARCAFAAACSKRRLRRLTIGTLAPDDRRHGTAGGYTNCGCRCDECRTAAAAYQREYRQRRAAAS